MEINTEIVGLDIGLSHITAIRLVPEGDKLGTVGVWSVGLPSNVWDAAGNVQEPSILQAALKHLKKQITPRPRKVSVAIPGRDLLLQRMRKPSSLSREDITLGIKSDIASSLPYDEEDAQITFRPLSLDQEEDMLDLVAVACHKDVSVTLTRLLESAGFEAEAILPGPLVNNRSISVGENTWAELLVSIGLKTTVLSVVSDKNVYYAKTIHIGGEDLTEAIAAAVGSSLAEAEHFKVSHSLVAPEHDPHLKERQAMRGWADQLTNEIYTVLSAQESTDPVQSIFLTGGGAHLDGLRGYLTRNLGLPTDIAEPTSNLIIEDEDKFSRYSTAYALALEPSKKGKSAKGLNFSRKTNKKTNKEAK